MNFLDHLEELRRRILQVVAFIIISSILLYPLSNRIIDFFVLPIGKTYFFSPQEAILVRIKVSIFLSLFISFPYILIQAYLFVSPGLYHEERRYVRSFLLLFMFLFYLGVFVSFLFLPYFIHVLLSFSTPSVSPMINISRYLTFLFWVSLGLGLGFEIPGVLLLLSKLGILSPRVLLRGWRFAVVLILIFSAIITPTVDIITQLLVSLPLFFLYLIGIIFSFIGRRSV